MSNDNEKKKFLLGALNVAARTYLLNRDPNENGFNKDAFKYLSNVSKLRKNKNLSKVLGNSSSSNKFKTLMRNYYNMKKKNTQKNKLQVLYLRPNNKNRFANAKKAIAQYKGKKYRAKNNGPKGEKKELENLRNWLESQPAITKQNKINAFLQKIKKRANKRRNNRRRLYSSIPLLARKWKETATQRANINRFKKSQFRMSVAAKKIQKAERARQNKKRKQLNKRIEDLLKKRENSKTKKQNNKRSKSNIQKLLKLYNAQTSAMSYELYNNTLSQKLIKSRNKKDQDKKLNIANKLVSNAGSYNKAMNNMKNRKDKAKQRKQNMKAEMLPFNLMRIRKRAAAKTIQREVRKRQQMLRRMEANKTRQAKINMLRRIMAAKRIQMAIRNRRKMQQLRRIMAARRIQRAARLKLLSEKPRRTLTKQNVNFYKSVFGEGLNYNRNDTKKQNQPQGTRKKATKRPKRKVVTKQLNWAEQTIKNLENQEKQQSLMNFYLEPEIAKAQRKKNKANKKEKNEKESLKNERIRLARAKKNSVKERALLTRIKKTEQLRKNKKRKNWNNSGNEKGNNNNTNNARSNNNNNKNSNNNTGMDRESRKHMEVMNQNKNNSNNNSNKNSNSNNNKNNKPIPKPTPKRKQTPKRKPKTKK